MKGICRYAWQVLAAGMVVTALGFADADSNSSPPPGTLNYVEGQVSVQGRTETPNAVGSTYLQPNQQMQTANGNAEMLLTPGVYLRLGHNSAVTMLSPGLADTEVELTRGSAMLEVDELFKQNNLSVAMNNSTTQIEKQGLYDFTVQPATVRVLDGEARVNGQDRSAQLKKGHELVLAQWQKQKFDRKDFENDELYRWSMLRSQYATQSNVNEGYALESAGGWWGPGWYWDPMMWDFAFMPGWGFGWGPFGYPFFSPWMVGYAPYYGFGGYGYGGRRFGSGMYHYPAGAGNRSLPSLAHQPARGSAGFRSFPHGGMGMNGMGMARGGMAGGFHGGFAGGGGFHGGFAGGGFHGGGGRR